MFPAFIFPPKNLISIGVLIAANCVPLAGVIWLGWDAASIVQVFWMENLIIGFYFVLKIALAGIGEPGIQFRKFYVIPFFCAHYGGFCAGHGMFLQLIFNVGGDREAIAKASLVTSTWPLDIVSGRLLLSVVARAWKYAPDHVGWVLIALFISHGVTFIQDYPGPRGPYPSISEKDFMMQPYRRIVLLHGAILGGGFLASAPGTPVVLLAALVVFKICADVWFHNKYHRAVQAQTPVLQQ